MPDPNPNPNPNLNPNPKPLSVMEVMKEGGTPIVPDSLLQAMRSVLEAPKGGDLSLQAYALSLPLEDMIAQQPSPNPNSNSNSNSNPNTNPDPKPKPKPFSLPF